MTDLAVFVPSPAAVQDVHGLCQQIEAWVPNADDVGLLHDTKAKLAAIDQYLAQTSTEGRKQIVTTMRRLEVRIGELLPPAKETQGRALPREDEVLTQKERHYFREMAANPEVVAAITRLSGANGGVNGLLGRAAHLHRQFGGTKAQAVAAASVEFINRGKGGKKLPDWWKSAS